MKYFKVRSFKFLKPFQSLKLADFSKSLRSLKYFKSVNWFRNKPKINPEKERQEKITDIGSKLRQERLEQGISLDELAQTTRIQIRLLKAIEEGNLQILPEPIYIREFLKQFANALGLNGTEIASQFPTY